MGEGDHVHPIVIYSVEINMQTDMAYTASVCQNRKNKVTKKTLHSINIHSNKTVKEAHLQIIRNTYHL